jgi:predicted nucleotidyltransferase component of viral defense system
VLDWVLAGILRDQLLANSWMFKGGTWLKKCSFETYRFSEDLAFTVRDAAQLEVGPRIFTGIAPSAWKADSPRISR